MTTTVAPSSSTRPAIAAILAHQRGGHAVSLLADLCSSRRCHQRPIRFSARAQRRAQRPQRHALLIGYTFIRARNIKAHRAAMITAFCFSTLFLVSYILHHALHGDVRYPVHAALAPSTCRCWPATSFWPSSRCRWCWSLFSSRSPDAFRSTARSPAGPFPLWLYVSVTGVIT